jgi:CRISPR-associated protein Csm5
MIRQIKINITTLTPLHIGTGRKLTRDFDYVAKEGRTYRIREEGMLNELTTRVEDLTAKLSNTFPGRLLKGEDLESNSPLVRYVLIGVPGGREFREQIKDVHDRPYLPGSSLKGALRTVLAWHGWKEKKLSLSSANVGRNKKYAAKEAEAKIFGRDPNHDLLRALRISDSSPSSTDTLAIEQIQVLSKRRPGAPISVEAVKERTTFTLRASIDESLFSADWSGREAGFPLAHRDWLSKIPAIARARAEQRIKRELSWWSGNAEPEKLRDIQSALHTAPEEAFPLQLGFGSGWEGTTIGAPLKEDDNWPEEYRRLELGPIPRRRNAFVAVEDFPSSRRVVVRGATITPLGWVWVTWKEEK